MKYFLLALSIALCLCLFGCGSASLSETTAPISTAAPTEPSSAAESPTEPELTEPEPTVPPTSPVIDTLKQLYEPDGTVTPVDYTRMTYLAMEGYNDLITWTVDVDESLVRIVPNGDGTVTVDINELCEAETPYTLTASVVNADRIRVSHSWQYILPQARDMAEILDEAYALPLREKLPYQATLTGTVTAIDKAWSEDYQNVTVIIRVEAASNRSVRCSALEGEGTQFLKIGDTITVTGTLQRYGNIVEFDSGCELQTPAEPTSEED